MSVCLFALNSWASTEQISLKFGTCRFFEKSVENFQITGIPKYIQQDATLHILLCLETALHISGGTITHHQERIQLYLQHLVFVTPLLLSAAIVEELELRSNSST